MKRLPRKPSRLIRLALSDLKDREVDPNYIVNMGRWHMVTSHGRPQRCNVCFAGSILARVGKTSSESYAPLNASAPKAHMSSLDRKLHALNQFRVGCVRKGLLYLGAKCPENVAPFRRVPGYEFSPVAFHKAMERLAKKLESVGL